MKEKSSLGTRNSAQATLPAMVKGATRRPGTEHDVYKIEEAVSCWETKSQDTFLKECSDKVWNSLCWTLPFLKWTLLSSRMERIGLMGKDRNGLRNFHLGT